MKQVSSGLEAIWLIKTVRPVISTNWAES